METRDSDSISDTIITKYGNNIPVILSVSRVFSGGNLYFQLFIRDVSKEEELKQKLIRSRDFYLKVLDTFPAMIWRAGLDKRCNYFNQTWLEFTGKKMEQELGDGWTEGVHADDFDMCLNTYISSFDARNPFSMEYRLLNRFGEYRWILDIGRPLYDINDEFYGYLGACFDITEYRDLVDQVQKSNQSKSIFLANMSHDIRTPLAGIIGILDLILENNYEGGEKGKTELLRKALSSSKSLSELLNDIVDMTRIETGKLEIRPEPVSIPQLIQEACILFKIPIQEKNLKLHTTLDPMAPCLMDPVRLKQVLYNLLSNAWKYTDRGEIKIHLENRTHEGNPCFSISVSDTGRGIPKEDQPHIFQQFIQAKGLKSKGSGLGLSITRELVQMMNGKIWFESQRNMGSTFHIVLPFVSADMKKEKSDKTEHTLIHTNHQLKILIAEDNDVNRMIATTVLKKSGHVVYCAENGKEALNILSLKPVDLVLMDGSMPVMDGIEATSFIRSGENRDIPKDLPIIALTAHALKGDEQLFLSAGMNGYLTKPFNIDSFNEALHRLKF
jgi:PAS domain S-box-containing protein